MADRVLSKSVRDTLRASSLDLSDYYQQGALSEEQTESLEYPILHELAADTPRYEQFEWITAGGEKEIYHVHDVRADRCVVLARPLRKDCPKVIESFLYEGRLTACLEHPNIVPVHDVGTDEQGPYFSMKLLRGEPLSSILTKLREGDSEYLRRYDLNARLAILLKVCDALCFAHSKGILHLDVKPSNILVGRFGEVQLCDWGLARFRQGRLGKWDGAGAKLQGGVCEPGAIVGTPGYMSPEQMKGEVLDVQADVFALGVLLHELLGGGRPYPGKHRKELYQTMACSAPELASEDLHGESISESLLATVRRALQFSASKRYASVEAFASEISRYLSGYSTQAQEAGFVIQLSLFYQRNRGYCQLFGIAALFILLLSAAFLYRLDDERRQAMQARDAAVAAEAEARETLRLYDTERERREELEFEAFEIVRLVQSLEDYSRSEEFLELVHKALRNPHLREEDRLILWSKKALFHFVLHEFDACLGALAKSDLSKVGLNKLQGSKLEAIAQAMLKIKPDDAEELTESQFNELVKLYFAPNRMPFGTRGFEVQCYQYYHYRRLHPNPDPRECLESVTNFLCYLNMRKPPKEIAWRLQALSGGGHHLDLRWLRFEILMAPVSGLRLEQANLLAPLQLRSLNLGDYPYRLDSLRGLGLEELTVYGKARVMTLWPRELGLKRLHLERTISKQSLQQLTDKGVKVLYSKEEYADNL